MTKLQPLKSNYLASLEKIIDEVIAGYETDNAFEFRLEILEAVAARFGGFDLGVFHHAFGINPHIPVLELIKIAEPIASSIENTTVHYSLILSTLSREVLYEHDRKSTGAYHTDFRLASRLAELAAADLTHQSSVIDPACGAGILLVALTLAVCGADRTKTAHWFSHGVCAADLSPNSMRAALLSLASLTDNVNSLVKMRKRWFCGDSLLADPCVWSLMAPNGFDTVIGNPPWEKIKLSRHEFIKASGVMRHYGADTFEIDEKVFQSQREAAIFYSQKLLARYPIIGGGDPDLYIAFTDLFLELCKSGGTVAALVPGGLIRSKGTASIRRKIMDSCNATSFSIIDNRAKFFAIDSRFKFLAIALTKSNGSNTKAAPIHLLHERGINGGVEIYGSAIIGRRSLSLIRKDLSLPEVRTSAEWKLFMKISTTGVPWDTPGTGWLPKFCREVDMTKEKSKFLTSISKNAIALVEGRMVHSHRFGVKGYVSGTGRRSMWESYSVGTSQISPQFWINPSDLNDTSKDRVSVMRVGFCDIAGQTNERSLTAALIPPGVACGNKVPTITFPEDTSEDRLFVWLAIANSFAFDWMLRRILTTTVNYFLLQSLPMPKLTKNGLPWKKLASCAAELRRLDSLGTESDVFEQTAIIRAVIDAEVAIAYGLGLNEMKLMFADFLILDRGQPALPGEQKSFITRDLVMLEFTKRIGACNRELSHRVMEAKKMGAVAYVPLTRALTRLENKKVSGESHG